jgi:hypothetical protein
MQTYNLKPPMTRHGSVAASVAGLMVGAITLVLVLGLTAAHAGFQPASAMAAEPQTIQQQRVELIRELRAENLADFEAMERAPGLYTEPDSSTTVQLDRVATLVELREQNLADFDAMERSPGLYT